MIEEPIFPEYSDAYTDEEYAAKVEQYEKNYERWQIQNQSKASTSTSGKNPVTAKNRFEDFSQEEKKIIFEDYYK